MRILAILLSVILVLTGCSGCAGSYRSVQPEGPFSRIERSTVRIEQWCGDMPISLGSGVAIAANQVLTAAHVVETPDTECYPSFTYRVFRWDGKYFIGTPVNVRPHGVDIARIEMSENVFEPATVGPVPSQGDKFCGYGWDAPDDFRNGMLYWEAAPMFKCDVITRTIGDTWYSGLHAVHGNSGGGIWNERGEVIGLITMGAMDSEVDYWTLGPIVAPNLDGLFK